MDCRYRILPVTGPPAGCWSRFVISGVCPELGEFRGGDGGAHTAAESIRKLAKAVRPQRVIFEFLKEEREIAADRAEIPRRVFDLIAKETEESGWIEVCLLN